MTAVVLCCHVMCYSALYHQKTFRFLVLSNLIVTDSQSCSRDVDSGDTNGNCGYGNSNGDGDHGVSGGCACGGAVGVVMVVQMIW